jgi:hypothetical protein
VLTGSGLGQQNASTRRCCSPIRSNAERGYMCDLALETLYVPWCARYCPSPSTRDISERSAG